MILTLIVILALAGLGWIRFAPSDPAFWHVDPMVTADQDLTGGVRRRLDGGAAKFAALHALILATPRTELLAGGPDDGRATYVTRSRWMGFPDYTTVQATDADLEIWARLRFGQSDMGVNKARVDGWLAALRAQAEG